MGEDDDPSKQNFEDLHSQIATDRHLHTPSAPNQEGNDD